MIIEALSILTTEVMILIWGFIFGLTIYVSFKSRVYGLLVLAGGIVPLLIFYAYKLFNVWSTSQHAILYSRFALMFLAISIGISVASMYRSIYDGKSGYTDSS